MSRKGCITELRRLSKKDKGFSEIKPHISGWLGSRQVSSWLKMYSPNLDDEFIEKMTNRLSAGTIEAKGRYDFTLQCFGYRGLKAVGVNAIDWIVWLVADSPIDSKIVFAPNCPFSLFSYISSLPAKDIAP